MVKNDTRTIPDKAFTHGAGFHADDVFGAALLRLLNPNIKIERGFKVPEDYDGIVFDIGQGEFDHHQRDNEVRENGVPYASFGKLWQAFGNRLVSEKAVEEIDKNFIQDLDLSDNTGTHNYLSEVISIMNPSWTDPNPDSNGQFEKAVTMATDILQNIITRENDKDLANKIAQEALANAKCKEIIILSQFAPVIENLIDTDAKFVIFPASRGGYMVQVIPKEIGTKEAKIDLPKEWGGHREDLSEINKIEDMIFCHNALFCCSAQSLESAIKCAVIALNKKVEYDKKFDEAVKDIMSKAERQQTTDKTKDTETLDDILSNFSTKEENKTTTQKSSQEER